MNPDDFSPISHVRFIDEAFYVNEYDMETLLQAMMTYPALGNAISTEKQVIIAEITLPDQRPVKFGVSTRELDI